MQVAPRTDRIDEAISQLLADLESIDLIAAASLGASLNGTARGPYDAHHTDATGPYI